VSDLQKHRWMVCFLDLVLFFSMLRLSQLEDDWRSGLSLFSAVCFGFSFVVVGLVAVRKTVEESKL
jgi:hypothetical protein